MVALTKDASATTLGLEKEKGRFPGKERLKVVRISEEVQIAEWPRGRIPGSLWEKEADWQDTVEVYSVEVCPEEVSG
jgi:hypothetical protein